MANYWVHNGFLQVEGEKMAKSLGNFVTIRDLLRDWPGEVVRLAMLQTHYRQPLNWTTNSLREAQRVLDHWYELTGDVAPKMLCADVLDALTDDLNTPKAVVSLHELRTEAARGNVAQDKVTALIAARNVARRVKNFRESDRIRDELAKMGIVVKDTKDGTTW